MVCSPSKTLSLSIAIHQMRIYIRQPKLYKNTFLFNATLRLTSTFRWVGSNVSFEVTYSRFWSTWLREDAVPCAQTFFIRILRIPRSTRLTAPALVTRDRGRGRRRRRRRARSR